MPERLVAEIAPVNTCPLMFAFEFNADCKSVWSERVPVIEPQVPLPPDNVIVVPDIVSPLPTVKKV